MEQKLPDFTSEANANGTYKNVCMLVQCVNMLLMCLILFFADHPSTHY